MMPTVRNTCSVALVAVSIAAAVWAAVAAAPQNAPPQATFRTVVSLVPVDVRVIDNKTGKPVNDLEQEDFTILEDGVRQQLVHFLSQALSPDPAGTTAPLVIPSAIAKRSAWEPAKSIPAQNRRVFLIVLGNGRLQGPSKGLDALLQFLRTRLLPQDQAAVYAYDRATDFTTDHEKVAQVIDRFKAENDAITGEANFHSEGLAAIYGSGELPDSVQRRIDKVFFGSDTLPAAVVGRAENAKTAERVKRDTRRQVEGALDAAIASGRLTPEGEEVPTTQAALAWGTFDNFVARNGQTLRDMGNLYAAIAYMREIEGEKHLVFLDGVRSPEPAFRRRQGPGRHGRRRTGRDRRHPDGRTLVLSRRDVRPRRD